MTSDEQTMTIAQRASLVSAAFRHPHPLDFLDAAVMTFRVIGRYGDATATAWIGCLYAEGELEILMGLRAAWERGEDRSPAEAAKATMRCEG